MLIHRFFFLSANRFIQSYVEKRPQGYKESTFSRMGKGSAVNFWRMEVQTRKIYVMRTKYTFAKAL